MLWMTLKCYGIYILYPSNCMQKIFSFQFYIQGISHYQCLVISRWISILFITGWTISSWQHIPMLRRHSETHSTSRMLRGRRDQLPVSSTSSTCQNSWTIPPPSSMSSRQRWFTGTRGSPSPLFYMPDTELLPKTMLVCSSLPHGEQGWVKSGFDFNDKDKNLWKGDCAF